MLETKRLILNKPSENDRAELIQNMNSTPEISENTLSIPFPYTDEHADFWFNIINDGFKNKDAFIFAIRQKANLKLIGAVGLHLTKKDQKAEVGYWLAKVFWNKGYTSEALQAAIRFGFQELNLNKIYASHYTHNPSSGRVMEKCGMKKEGILKQEIFKNGKFLDLNRFAILKNQYNG